MKKILLLIFICASISLSAQETSSLPDLFSFSEPLTLTSSTKFSKSGNDKMGSRIKNPMNVEVRKVTFKNMENLATAKEFDTLSPSYLTVKIPKRKKKKGYIEVLAVPQRIEAYENGGYLYVAELVKGGNQKGTLVLTHNKGQNYGSITFGKRVFTIESNGVDDDYLIEVNNKKLDNEAACGAELVPKLEKSESSANKNTINSLTARNGGNCNVRVLVLFTDNANAVSNPQQLATTLIAESNSALQNSRIFSNGLRFSLVGTQRIAFNDRGDATARFLAGRDNAQVRQLRNQFHADLVIMLTDGNWVSAFGTTFGVSSLNEFNDPVDGYFATVEADAGGFTFAHEIAHNLGARHNTDTRVPGGAGNLALPPNLSATAKGHSWYKRNCFFCQKLYRKSVLSTRGSRGIRQPYYSNPAVKAESKARGNTGTSTRNNFQQLVNGAPIVAAYDPFQELTASITGPSSVNIGDQYTMSARVSNCPGTNYRWERSENGFNYFNAGAGASISSFALPLNGGNQVYYRLRVTCNDGQTRTVFRTVYINEGGGGFPIFAKEGIADKGLDIPNEDSSIENIDSMVVYPNAAKNEVFITTNFQKESNIEVRAINILRGGKGKKVFGGKSFIGPGELRLDVSNMDQGLYQLEMYENGIKVLSKRFLISR